MANIRDRTVAPQKGVADETTPLIAPGTTSKVDEIENGEVEAQTSDSEESEKLPMAQIMLLCFARITEPIAFFSESILSFTQMLHMIPWGRAADKFGRKLVRVISMAGLSVTSALFGTSRSIWQMIMYRSIAGVFSGSIVAVRASISENSTPRTQARAFGHFAFSNNLGIFLGPFMGGALSRPADQYPSVFGRIQFFRDYPYALPTFTTGLIGATACVISALFIKETLKKTPKKGVNGLPPKVMTITEIMKSPGVSRVLFIYTFTMLLALAYTAIVPVFYFTSVKLGGYGFSEFQISIFIGVGGLSQAIWLLLIFPRLQRRIGAGAVMRFCASVCQFAACQLAINDISPSPETLGTVNAISLTLNSDLRTVAPALFASLFATGIKEQIFKGYFAWFILILLAIGYRGSLRWLPAKAEGKINSHSTTATGFRDTDE
ncbi:conserved hypothetical protein [Talaromyces stipitatus ATCC 10500]|uniref:Major facilitator superfamily (MFS) profile domain-containing protein n=1 Tax=Talaromyces stipitatus (strain ATCC 10500 / CBS 375.48 / QM 6759 / NRRL 1006) TaxID=441959 RepID=B8LXX8_TALSN|nr:uncharacterized protein TSTA_062800 [Talaromyces stipitatus ATCC 10500]EED22793.1 conserved hypothetical protein [Talaromyces stipitatus ATCC 10500]